LPKEGISSASNRVCDRGKHDGDVFNGIGEGLRRRGRDADDHGEVPGAEMIGDRHGGVHITLRRLELDDKIRSKNHTFSNQSLDDALARRIQRRMIDDSGDPDPYSRKPDYTHNHTQQQYPQPSLHFDSSFKIKRGHLVSDALLCFSLSS